MHRRARFLNGATAAFVLVMSLWTFSAPLRHMGDAMRYVADDFYYYLKIAANVAAGHGSTFDGSRLTNGYHPLYMLLWVPVARAGQSLQPVFALLFVLSVAAAITVFLCGRRVIAMAGCDALLSNALALLLLALPFRMFFQGMEVTLTIPLSVLLVLLWLRMFGRDKPTALQGAALGVAAVAMVLSRLDSALLVLLLLLYTLASAELRRRISSAFAAAFAASAGLPLSLYLLSNRIWFGTLMPVSGMAKQLRNTHLPSALALGSLVRGTNGKLLVLIAALAIAAWFAYRRQLAPQLRAVLGACAVFPVLHSTTLIVLSDWQMWGWYHYSFVPALLALLALAAFGTRRLAATNTTGYQVAAYLLLAIGIALTAANHWKLDGEMEQIDATAKELAPWMDAHPGLYAMGDRAGMVAWRTSQPIFQTEGLVEDREWLDVLRAQGSLLTALRAKGVRYYIATDWLVAGPAGRPRVASGNCVLAIEPAQAGPSAPHLSATLCAPVAEFDAGGDLPKRTLVYELSR